MTEAALAATAEPVSPAFAAVLRSGRDEFNRRFAVARHIYPDLDADTLLWFLKESIDPFVPAVAEEASDRLSEVAMAAYDVALQVVGKRLAGTQSLPSLVSEAWRRILPRIPSQLAASPNRVCLFLTNAVHNVEQTPGSRPQQWLDLMEAHAGSCAGLEALLCLGQVAAWRSGLAHYRNGALTAADSVPEPLVLSVLGAPPGVAWSALREGLLANPWFDAGSPGATRPAIRLARETGAFRGFGGLFPEPPRVAAQSGALVVTSGADAWLLAADLYGATFHRVAADTVTRSDVRTQLPSGIRVDLAQGAAWRGSESETLPAAGELTSVAATEHTVALTFRLTHKITLLAVD